MISARDTIITADDVVRGGACASGVAEAVQRYAGQLAAAMPASAVLRLVDPGERRYVRAAAKLDGYGDGSGSGYGDGSGSGSGSGYGYGYGSGYGYGDGYGDGSGYG
ncbi:MAG: hypothetical protein ABJQ26_08665 [Maricaulis sp.]